MKTELNGPDLLSALDEALCSNAVELFHDLLLDFCHRSFTLEDIRRLYRKYYEDRVGPPLYREVELEVLVMWELIIEDDGGYVIDHFNPHVGRIFNEGRYGPEEDNQ